MPSRIFTAIVLIHFSLLFTGCSSTGKVNYKVAPSDWDEVSYGYLNVQTVPEGAVISLRITGTFEAIIKKPFKDEVKVSNTESNDWTAVGSAPLVNHKLALSCKDVQRKDGATIQVWYKADKVSVRMEKTGYKSITIDSVALNPNKDDQNKLVVELEPSVSWKN